MKWFSYLLFGIVFFAIACKKDNPKPTVDPTPSEAIDTSYLSSEIASPQEKVILLEEFTGVYCYTCPLAHQVVAQITERYPNQVAALNIHSHFFGIYDNPQVLGNTNDFRTEDGDSIVSMLGGVVSVPSGAIDRTIQSGETGIITQNRESWEDYVTAALSVPPAVNIDVETEFNSDTRALKIVTELQIVNDISEELRLSIAFGESNIIDKQLNEHQEIVEDYSHQHIFRDMLTDIKGIPLSEGYERGRIYVRIFDFTLPENWDENNLDIITFVHKGGNQRMVYQTNKAKVKS